MTGKLAADGSTTAPDQCRERHWGRDDSTWQVPWETAHGLRQRWQHYSTWQAASIERACQTHTVEVHADQGRHCLTWITFTPRNFSNRSTCNCIKYESHTRGCKQSHVYWHIGWVWDFNSCTMVTIDTECNSMICNITSTVTMATPWQQDRFIHSNYGNP